jgi:hypothetical protein
MLPGLPGGREIDRMSFKTRVLLAGLVACVLMGSVAAGSAYAEAGPFFFGRELGSKGEGEKLSESKPVGIVGEGSEQTIKGTISTTPIEIVSKSLQEKGIIYNNALQGQAKLLLVNHEPKLVKPVLKECEVKFGTNNEVKVEGHLVWKWNGEKKQLEETPPKGQSPGLLFTPAPIEAGATKLPEGIFTEIGFKGVGCGVLAGKFAVKGSLAATPKPVNVGEWSASPTATFPGWKQEHFWNGKESIGAAPGLVFAGNPAEMPLECKATVNIEI